MKYLGFLLFFFLLCASSHETTAQLAQQRFEVRDTIPIRAGTNQYRLYRLATKWLENERGTRLLARSFRDRQLVGRGYFIYYNRVQLPGVFLGPRANERTNGSIVFNIHVHIQDSIIVVRFYDFIHEAAFSEYGSMTFGRLMTYDRVPPGRCMEIEEWCDAVWADMKRQSELECKYRVNRMIPIVLIRRRTFRAREQVEESVEEEYVDPQEYLNIERYIIHDRQERRRTVTEEPVAETTSADDVQLTQQDESPVASSEQRRGRREQDDDDDDDEVSTQSRNEPTQTRGRAREQETEKSEVAASQPKEKVEKEAKPAKQKKPKKPKKQKKPKYDDDDDDYWDDDDY